MFDKIAMVIHDALFQQSASGVEGDESGYDADAEMAFELSIWFPLYAALAIKSSKSRVPYL